MKTFKTLDELDAYNSKQFEMTFGSVKHQQPENPFEKHSFDALKFDARPHDVFRLDWSNYSSLDFADTFLPYVAGFRAKASYVFDGAELFKNSRKVSRKLLPLTKSDKLVTLITYTYPKGVLAAERKNRISIKSHEALVFLEVDEFGDIDMSFRFGRDFKSYLRGVSKADSKKGSSTTSNESPIV